MGYYAGLAKFNKEKEVSYLMQGIIYATILHGFYDFFLFQNVSYALYIGAAVSLIIGIRFTRKAIRIHKAGGPEVLAWEDVTVDKPGAGQILVRHGAVGVNYIDVYHRTGLYPITYPSGIGMEGAGTVEAVGSGVTD